MALADKVVEHHERRTSDPRPDPDRRGSVAEGGPGGTARRLDQLDEDAVARSRMEERHRPLGAAPRGACRSARPRRSRAG